MQEIIIIAVAISLIDLWIYELILPITLSNHKGIKGIFKLFFGRKPFNCERCLSFWVGLILSIVLFNIIYLTLPLIIKLKNKL